MSDGSNTEKTGEDMMLKLILTIGIVGFLALLGLAGFCFYLARKAEDERLADKKEKEEQAILDASLEELVDKELEARYKASGQKAER
ncbi:MAG: hypothetical protein IKQ56_05960 [Lachnospiraceae bacterium]|nr:hypothetical protein [Lachnospiraceae bacterium]